MVFNFLRKKEKVEWISPDPKQRARTAQLDKISNKIEETKRTKSDIAKSKRRILPTSQERFEIGKRVGTFVKTGATLREDISREQEMLGSMFGQGEHIWGVNNEPVKINHDLNPRQRGDNGTAELFGFG